jgi:hypothetical protein
MIRGTHKFGDEDGAVLVVVAAALSAIVLIVALVLSTASWFERHRHLQLQADAGALAGASSFNACVSASAAERANPASTVNTTIENLAKQFAGSPSVLTPYNSQVVSSAGVSVFVNSAGYGSAGLDNSEIDPAPGGPPCKSGYVDVKVTDTNLAWLFHAGPLAKVNTHARVSILQLSTLQGSLPLAVEDVNPLAAGALFVNEDSSDNVLARTPLTGGAVQTLNGQSLTTWTGAPTQISLSSSAAHVGVVIALCSNKSLCSDPADTNWLNGSLATVCGHVFVRCHSSGAGATPGLELIYGYNGAGTGSTAAPIVRATTLTSGTCGDDSSPYFLLNGGCSIGGNVQVDFGLTTDPTRAPSATPPGVSAAVTLQCNGGNGICPNNANSCTMTYQGTVGTVSNWSASNCITVKSGAAQAPLDLRVTWTTGTGRNAVNHTLNLADVARPFANNGPPDDQSYPIAYAKLAEGQTCTGLAANSVAYGSHYFCVGIGLLGNLKDATDVSDPTKLLKFVAGSHTGAVDCEPDLPGGSGATKFFNEIKTGCSTPVQLNDGSHGACPDTLIPYDCLPVFTGAKTGPTNQAMDARFVPNGVCPPNHWTAPAGSLPNIPQGDPRVVPLIITLFGAFGGSGGSSATDVPVTNFAAFYVTGWSNADPACNGINEADPPGAGNAAIWGHFIKYLGDLGTSTGGTACNFSAFSPCITVMTR